MLLGSFAYLPDKLTLGIHFNSRTWFTWRESTEGHFLPASREPGYDFIMLVIVLRATHCTVTLDRCFPECSFND